MFSFVLIWIPQLSYVELIGSDSHGLSPWWREDPRVTGELQSGAIKFVFTANHFNSWQAA